MAIDRFMIQETYPKTEMEMEDVSSLDAIEVQISAFPNPFAKVLKVNIPEQDSEVNLVLYNLQGQRFLERNISRGNESIQIDTQDIPAGGYLLQISGNGKVKVAINTYLYSLFSYS